MPRCMALLTAGWDLILLQGPFFVLNNGSSAQHVAAKATVFRSEFLIHLDVSGWLDLAKGT